MALLVIWLPVMGELTPDILILLRGGMGNGRERWVFGNEQPDL